MLCSDPCPDSNGRVAKEDSGWTISVIGQTWVCLNWYEQLKTDSHVANWFIQPPTPDSLTPPKFYGILFAFCFVSCRLANFGWVQFFWLPCAKLAMKQDVEFPETCDNSGLIFPCGPDFTKCWNHIEEPSWSLTPFPDCLFHVLFRRYSLLSRRSTMLYWQKTDKNELSIWPPNVVVGGL